MAIITGQITGSAFKFGTESQLAVDASGRLGIGTTSPGYTLDLVSGDGNLMRLDRSGVQIGAFVSATNPFFGTLSNNPLLFMTNSTEKMRIDASGNLGVGTTSPYSGLHLIGNMTVGNSTYSRPALTTTNWGYSAEYRVLMLGSTSTSYATQNTGSVTIAFNYDPSGNANGSFNGDGREIIFRNGTQFVTPNSANTSFNLSNLVLLDGNVGIGTTSPIAKLHVQGSSVYLSTTDDYASGTTGSGLIVARGAATGNTYSQIYGVQSGGTSYANLVVPGGNVGIGTTSPGSKLHVYGDPARIQIQSSGRSWMLGTDTGPAGLYLAYDFTAGASRVFVDHSGNVGIGTTSPTVHSATNGALVVRGAGTSRGIIELWDGGDTGKAVFQQVGSATYIGNLAGNGDLILLTNGSGTSATEAVTIKANGNVGIGTTSPATKLHVATGNATGYLRLDAGTSQFGSLGVQFRSFSDAYTSEIGAYQANLLFITQGTERVRITSVGNVGIGTTNPGDKLHVVGNIEVGATSNQHIVFRSASSWYYYLKSVNDDFFLQDPQSVNYFAAYYNGGGTGKYASILGALNVINNGNVGIGTTSPGSYKLYVQGDQYISGTLTEASSIALKENINPITDALSIIKNITGYTYDRKDGSAINQSGLIAEEVVKVLPGVVSRDQDGNPSGVQYTKIIAYLVESIKELKSELDELKRQ